MGGPRRPRAAGTQAARVVAGLSPGGSSQLSNLGLQGWWDVSREAERGRESVWGSKIPSPPPGGFLPAGCHPRGPACPWPAGAGGGFGGAFLLQERATGTVGQLSPCAAPPVPPYSPMVPDSVRSPCAQLPGLCLQLGPALASPGSPSPCTVPSGCLSPSPAKKRALCVTATPLKGTSPRPSPPRPPQQHPLAASPSVLRGHGSGAQGWRGGEALQ